MKNRLITWALKGFGTIARKLAVALVGFLISFGFVITKDMEDKMTAVFSFLIVALGEFVVFKIRTREGKNIQRAVGAKPDGVPLRETTLKAQAAAYRIHGGRPG